MSKKTRHMSRRAVLAAAGLTPAALLLLSYRPEANAQILAASAAFGLSNEAGWKFAEVWKNLWTAFCFGAGDATIGDDVLKAALNKSGLIVADRLDDFPADGKDVKTLMCAFICGTKAATAAKANNSGTINKDIFDQAWQETKDETTSVVDRAGRMNGGREKAPSGLGC